MDAPPLFVVADVLVFKALETMGKWIVRAERSRFRVLGDQPWYVAHTIWQPDDAVVDKALRGAWDMLPAVMGVYGCCGITATAAQRMLDQYVHDLVITGTAHTQTELRYRFEVHLGMEVTDHAFA